MTSTYSGLNTKEISSLVSEVPIEPIANAVLSTLAGHGIALETQSYPAILFAQSLLYMTYWFHRFRDPARKATVRDNISQYLCVVPSHPVVDSLLTDANIKSGITEWMDRGVVVRKTIDVLVTREVNSERQILTIDRSVFPAGISLPGGLLRDDDEHNDLGIPGNLFAALRVAGTKVLGSANPTYGISEQDGRKYYFAQNETGNEARIFMDRTISHAYRDHLKDIAVPSDPRHIVDTVGFLVEISKSEEITGRWLPDSVITTPYANEGTFAFGHHKQMAASLLAKNFTKTQGLSHHEWIREIVKKPLEMYESMRERFRTNGNNIDTHMPELLPVVEYFRSQMSNPTMEDHCSENPAISFMRDQIMHKLHHVTIQNGAMCPYNSTVRILFESVGFFDVVARTEKNLSTHFQKKYWYRYEELMRRIPDAIVIPTFDNISATDLMKVRGTPIYFIGLSPDPVYVDEFWQSPLEFLIHDLNHAWKMLDMDDRYLNMHPSVSRTKLMKKSNSFIQEFFPRIAIQKTDTEEEKEMKKLKKIILFEVGHEDARPLLPELICDALLENEGYEFPDNVIRYDDGEKQAYLEKRTIPGITALSYVRHKLQHGFFDQTDSQNIQIVSPMYRSVELIVKAAEELLNELGARLTPTIEAEGLTQYLTRQACSRGPAILHAPENLDPAIDEYGDGTVSMPAKVARVFKM